VWVVFIVIQFQGMAGVLRPAFAVSADW
jgi:hypothetical protein